MTDWINRLTRARSSRETDVLNYVARARALCESDYHLQGSSNEVVVVIAWMLQAQDERSRRR